MSVVRKNTGNENSDVRKAKKIMPFSNCTTCAWKKLIFIKNQKLSNFNNILSD